METNVVTSTVKLVNCGSRANVRNKGNPQLQFNSLKSIVPPYSLTVTILLQEASERLARI